MSPYSVLDNVRSPADLRTLSADALTTLADEIRRRLVETVSLTGGHLGPNLGVVELTIALHRQFVSPRDAIVWDIGHQAYVHKMITGRQDDFAGLRQAGGLSGYPSRAESPHDLVENSHASTALSYADGLAKGFRLVRDDTQDPDERRVVAVIGDGALTGGMCWEALNNIGRLRQPLVIVLNDNGRSYAPTVGSLAEHLGRLRQGDAAGNVFVDFGLDYIGPIDGHDIDALDGALASARRRTRPVVVHCITRKGAGFEPAETDEADCLHSINGKHGAVSGPHAAAWTDVFAHELVRIGERRHDVVAVTAAMLRPNGLLDFATRFPDRVFDVGIAEQHAVTSAAGLAMAGLHPVVALYATFLNRALDQVLMDVALHRLPVTFILNRAGITGPDGPSHHGMWDVSMLSAVPGLRVAAPRDADTFKQLLNEAVSLQDGPSVIRFPTGLTHVPSPALGHLGSADVLTPSQTEADVLLLPIGTCSAAAVQAAEQLQGQGICTTVANPRWTTCIDPELVLAAAEHQVVVTIEDNALPGGFGDALARALRSTGVSTTLVTLGLKPGFVGAGTRSALLAAHGLDADSIAAAACAARHDSSPPPGHSQLASSPRPINGRDRDESATQPQRVTR